MTESVGTCLRSSSEHGSKYISGWQLWDELQLSITWPHRPSIISCQHTTSSATTLPATLHAAPPAMCGAAAVGPH